jgi:tRNA 2-thiouridine synthesizing protein E
MATRTIAGKQVEVTDEGYLVSAAEWTREMAAEIAAGEGIAALGESHWKVISYLQSETKATGTMPSIRKLKATGVMPTKELYELFPDGPLKKAAKIAGLPKPASCV